MKQIIKRLTIMAAKVRAFFRKSAATHATPNNRRLDAKPTSSRYAPSRERIQEILRAHAAFGTAMRTSGVTRAMTSWPQPLGTIEDPDPEPTLVEVNKRTVAETVEPMAEQIEVETLERRLEEARERLSHRLSFLADVAHARELVGARA